MATFSIIGKGGTLPITVLMLVFSILIKDGQFHQASEGTAGIWMETPNLADDLLSSFGTWGGKKICPHGSFVTGSHFVQGEYGLSSISLQCSQLDSRDSFVETQLIGYGPHFENNGTTAGQGVNNYATGFAFQRWTTQEGHSAPIVYKGAWELRRNNEETFMSLPQGSFDIERRLAGCPEDWAICGFRVKFIEQTKETLEIAGTVTRLQFKCCYYCVPEEVDFVLRDEENDATISKQYSVQKTFGLHIDQSQNVGGQLTKTAEHTLDHSVGTTNQESLGFSKNVQKGLNSNTNLASHKNTNRGTGVTAMGDNTKSSNWGFNSHKSGGSRNGVTESKNFGTSGGTSNTVGRGSTSGSHKYGKGGGGFSLFFGLINAEGGGGTESNHGTQENRDVTTHHETHGSGGSTVDLGTHVDFGFGVNYNSESSSHKSDQIELTSNVEEGIKLDYSNGVTFTYDQGYQRSTENSVQKMLAHRFGQSSTSGFNWASTMSLVWRQEKVESDSFVCPAQHHCVVKQLLGKCGGIEYFTNKFVITHNLIRAKTTTREDSQIAENPSPREMASSLRLRNENWIEMNNLNGAGGNEAGGNSNTSTNHGVWGLPERCAAGSFVTQGQLDVDEINGTLNDLTLWCSRLNLEGELTDYIQIGGHTNFQGRGQNVPLSPPPPPPFSSSPTSYAIGLGGFSLVGKNGRRSFQILYHPPKNGGSKISPNFVQCPVGFAVCGLQLKMNGDEKLTGLALACCYHCLPEEKVVTRDSFNNSGPLPTTHSFKITIGSRQEKVNRTDQGVSGGQSTDSDGVNRMRGLQAGFTARFSNNSNHNFDWGHTSNDMWDRSEEKSIEYQCPAWHVCRYKQLVGKCGNFEIQTPYTLLESSSLDDGEVEDDEEEEEGEKNAEKIQGPPSSFSKTVRNMQHIIDTNQNHLNLMTLTIPTTTTTTTTTTRGSMELDQVAVTPSLHSVARTTDADTVATAAHPSIAKEEPDLLDFMLNKKKKRN